MTYSVFQPKTGMYTYYQSATTPRVSHNGGGPLGLTPEQAAHALPPGARKIGSGQTAKGVIAQGGIEIPAPNWLIAGGLLVAGFLLLRGLQ